MFVAGGFSGVYGDSIRTYSGQVYHDPQMVRLDVDGLSIRHRTGVAKIALDDLAEEDRRKCGLDFETERRYYEALQKRRAYYKEKELERSRYAQKGTGGYFPNPSNFPHIKTSPYSAVQESPSNPASDQLSNDSSEFLSTLRAMGIDSSIVVSLSARENRVTITVAEAWHYQHYQLRLQAAQAMWSIWARIRSPQDPDKARIRLVDIMGNEVGGSRMLGGSLIWVQK